MGQPAHRGDTQVSAPGGPEGIIVALAEQLS
jgi:hypothetical protein